MVCNSAVMFRRDFNTNADGCAIRQTHAKRDVIDLGVVATADRKHHQALNIGGGPWSSNRAWHRPGIAGKRIGAGKSLRLLHDRLRSQ
jgi:hypothetical protein